MAEKTAREQARRIIAENRKARHDYHIIETWEAGVALLGTEVKAIREGRVNLRDSYARAENGELCHEREEGPGLTIEETHMIRERRFIRVALPLPPDLPLVPNPEEVADWFEAPLDFVLDPINQQRMSAEFQGRTRHYYQIDWQDRRIWGATAAMLVNLTRRIG